MSMSFIRRQPSLPTLSQSRAFTLIELLVVISIISVLISVLLPALSAAHQAAYATACLSNLRQIGIAAMAYTGDNGDLFPTTRWRSQELNEIPPYLGLKDGYQDDTALTCVVSERKFPNYTRDGRPDVHPWRATYSVNLYVVSSNRDAHGTSYSVAGYMTRQSSSVRRPSEAYWFMDCGQIAFVPKYDGYTYDLYTLPGRIPTFHHAETANIVFVDGHAARVSEKQYRDSDDAYHPAWSRNPNY